MFNLFGKPYSSEVLKTSQAYVKGYVRIFENKPRPTPQHVCSPDGLWVLPTLTADDIRALRAQRYAKETDPLLVELRKDELMGENNSALIEEFQRKVTAIKSDLPFPKPNLLPSHYQPILTT